MTITELTAEQKDYYAKLGLAADKAIKNTSRKFTSMICKDLPPEISDKYCSGCEWQDFCQQRGGAGK